MLDIQFYFKQKNNYKSIYKKKIIKKTFHIYTKLFFKLLVIVKLYK